MYIIIFTSVPYIIHNHLLVKVRVTPIFKNKGSNQDVRKFRPICQYFLTS